MAYMMLMATCCNCKQSMTCNPDLVPSLRINGVKEPLCRACAERWEEIHHKTGTISQFAYDPQEVA